MASNIAIIFGLGNSYQPNTTPGAHCCLEGPTKLLLAIIARAMFDIETYLDLQPQDRTPCQYEIALEAFNYLHSQGPYSHTTTSFLSFESIMSEVFGAYDSKYPNQIRKQYETLPAPYTTNPNELNKVRKRYRLQTVRN